MDVHDAIVCKCKKVSIIMDKKMREHRIEHERFIIFLEDTTPFDNYYQVKIMRKNDFEKPSNMNCLQQKLKIFDCLGT